jgi:hypothetical protein
MTAAPTAELEQFTFADEFDQYEDRIIQKNGLDSKAWWYLGGLINAFLTETKDVDRQYSVSLPLPQHVTALTDIPAPATTSWLLPEISVAPWFARTYPLAPAF